MTDISRSIVGKTALVTGAASGMGQAIAELLAAEGARVAALDVNEEGLARTAHTIAQGGGEAITQTCDMADPAAIVDGVEAVRSHFGPIDIVVNNAGVSIPVDIGNDGYEAAWERTLAINLTAYARVVRATVDDLAREQAGRIVNIASTEGLGATAFISPYTASKHGVVGLTPSACRRARAARRHRERDLSRPDPNRHDRGDSRGCQTEVRATTRADASLRRTRGGCSHGVVTGVARCVVHHRSRHPRRRRPDGAEHVMESEIARKMHRTLEVYHGMIYFVPEARAEYEALGLSKPDFFKGYFASRASALGEVPGEVVVATFFNFHPDLVMGAVPSCWAVASADEWQAARQRGADAALRAMLGDALASPDIDEAAATGAHGDVGVRPSGPTSLRRAPLARLAGIAPHGAVARHHVAA